MKGSYSTGLLELYILRDGKLCWYMGATLYNITNVLYFGREKDVFKYDLKIGEGVL